MPSQSRPPFGKLHSGIVKGRLLLVMFPIPPRQLAESGPDRASPGPGPRKIAQMDDEQPSEELVRSLEQMGFPRESCIRAARLSKNNADAASEWLLQNSSESRSDAVSNLESNVQGLDGWRVVTRAPTTATIPRHVPDPLSILASCDSMNFQDTGSGVVLMSSGNPVCFAVMYESSWYGRMFAGQSREVMYELQDLEKRPFARMVKPFAWFNHDATVTIFADQASTELGKIGHEYDIARRKLSVSDSIPGHSAGAVRVEGNFTEGFFTILLGDSEIGRIERAKHGMGLAKLDLAAGALDAFRANRMRTLLVFVTLLVSDVYWGIAPIGFLKFPLPLLR
jgi:hypothetical protein